MDYFRARELPENPRESANCLSNLFFCWVLPVFLEGHRRESERERGSERVLNQDDLYQALESHKSKFLGDKLIQAWRNEIRNNENPSLMSAILSVFEWEIKWLGMKLACLEFFLRVTQPFFLGGLISYYSGNGSTVYQAYGYAIALVISSAINVVLTHPLLLGQLHCGMKIRVAVCSMIYRKALKLSKNALSDPTAVQPINLISNDVARFDQSIMFVHYLWLGPLETIAVTYLMYREIGISALIGVAFLLAFIPLQLFLGLKMGSLRKKTTVETDKRVGMMKEIIRGIQVIKTYVWEKPFEKMVAIARKEEIKWIQYGSYIRGILLTFTMFATRVSMFLSLVAFALLGNVMTAEKAFVIIAYYNILRQTMALYFPQGIGQLFDTQASVEKIQKYMMYEEQTKPSPDSNAIGINVHDVSARWNENSTELHNVSLLFQPRTLTCITGPVGAGKSILLEAILGELKIQAGSIVFNGVVSYASQDPWLFSGTIQSNILFGLPMNRGRYNDVVRKCALERDFVLFPDRDETIVSERGQNLSGGQKARISLARACYREADIYLLDDPLSAVDAETREHLFNQCFRVLSREKIVILVTHQLQYLQPDDRIVILNDGRVDGEGTNRNSNRQRSEARQTSLDDWVNENAMQAEENIARGAIRLSIYKKYFEAGDGLCRFYIMIVLCVMSQVLASVLDSFVRSWVADSRISNVTSVTDDTLYTETPTMIPEIGLRSLEDKDRMIDIYIFSAITVAAVVISLSRSFFFFSLAMKASTHLHKLMFEGVTRATMYFFNTNTSGRILNRFSMDMGKVDETLPPLILNVIQIVLSLVGIIVVVATANYWFLVPTAIIVVIFLVSRYFYLQTSRSVERMEATTRSPIYSHLGASLNGLPTIRALGAQDILIEQFDNLQDMHSSAFYMSISTARAFGLWLDFWCLVYIAIVTLSFFLMRDEGGNVGLAITQAMGMITAVQFGVRQSAELENTMTAVERVVEYETVDQESEFETTNPRIEPPAEWPENGEIRFDRVSVRYFPDPELVLRNLVFNIMPREKVGIVGRTGAGKSSLINALLRLSYYEGSITIDGLEINSIGLHDLRTKISIIPQEPVLFSGTIRYNLDPLNRYSDVDLWSALEDVNMTVAVQEHGLDSLISEGGGNFSTGERQLLCLARAILRRNRILVMDEPTANVDDLTDDLIQDTIRERFANCTILTITHRLRTVMNCDKVLAMEAMDAERHFEFGSPYELLTTITDRRIFHRMVEETGSFEELFQIAERRNEGR